VKFIISKLRNLSLRYRNPITLLHYFCFFRRSSYEDQTREISFVVRQ